MRRSIIIKPDVCLESLASAVLLQACVDAQAPNPIVAADAKTFLEHDASLWLEAAGLPYVDARFWAIKKKIRVGNGYLKKFVNR